jgi:hypothetical protein
MLCLAASAIAAPVGTTIESDVSLGQAVPLVNKEATVITSIELDKGTWIISGGAQFSERLPQTIVGIQVLNLSAWISAVTTFNHQGAYARDSRQYTPPFIGLIPLPITGRVFKLTADNTTVFLVARSALQSFGATSPSAAAGYGRIVATRVP